MRFPGPPNNHIMKKIYSLLCAAAVFVPSAHATFTDIEWTSGPWAYRQPIVDMTLSSIGSINGQVLDVEELIVPDPYGEDPANPGIARKITIVGPAGYGTRETYIYKVNQEEADNNTFRFGVQRFSAPETIQGEYTVTFPKGCMLGDGEPNPEFSVTFTVRDQTVYTPEEILFKSSPQTGVPQPMLDKVTLSFRCLWEEGVEGEKPGAEKYASKSIDETKKVTLTDVATGQTIDCSLVSTYSYTDQLAYAVTPAAPVTKAGTYRLTLPEGAIRLTKIVGTAGRESEEDVCNQTVSFTYIVDPTLSDDSVRPVASPAAGDVASVSYVEFYAPEGYRLFLPDSPMAATMTLPNGTTVLATPYTNPNVEGEMAFMKFDQTYTEPGTYVISFPRGCFELADAANTLIPTEPYVLTYNVVATTAVDFPYTSNPENGADVYFLQNVYVTFDQPVVGVAGVKPLCYRPDGTLIQNASMSFNATYNRLLVDLRFPTEFGTYKVVIPEGAVMNDSHQVNTAIELEFNFMARQVAEVDFNVFPDQGTVARLRTIEIEAPAGYTAMDRRDDGLTYVTFQVGDKQWKEYVTTTSDPLVCRVELSSVAEGRPEIKDNDEVAMIIGEGTFCLTAADGTQVLNATRVYSWLMQSGVEETLAATEGHDVYSTDGVKVLAKATRQQLQALKGIYIVNGRKVRF